MPLRKSLKGQFVDIKVLVWYNTFVREAMDYEK